MVTLKFVPTGNTYILDQFSELTPGPIQAARTIEKLTTNPVDIAYVGVRESGSALWPTGLGGKFYLTIRSKNMKVVRLPMSSAGAVTTAITGIQNAIATATLQNVAINLAADGTVS